MIFIDSTLNLDEHNLIFFILIAHSVCGALPLGKYFTESEISKTVIINSIITVLEYCRLLNVHSVPRSRTVVPGKIRTKRLKLYLLTHLYVKRYKTEG